MNASLILLAGSFSAFATRQVSDEESREAAIEAVRQSTQRADSFFSAHRREDLEEIFRSVRSPRQAGFELGPQIYEVSDAGYEFKNGDVQYHLSVHGPFVYFVAVVSPSSKTFRIGGFKDSQDEFNRLVKYCKINIRSEFQAQEYANLYLQLDPPHYRLVRAVSLLQLKQLAEREFDDRYKAFSLAESRFNEWWAKHENALAGIQLEPSTIETKEGFEIRFVTMSGIDEKSEANGPVPLRVELMLTKDGQIAEPKLSPVELR